jgi:hypothetical protein
MPDLPYLLLALAAGAALVLGAFTLAQLHRRRRIRQDIARRLAERQSSPFWTARDRFDGGFSHDN